MIPKSMPSGFDPMGGDRFSVKIMLKGTIQRVYGDRVGSFSPFVKYQLSNVSRQTAGGAAM
jgi:hypothetical protein